MDACCGCQRNDASTQFQNEGSNAPQAQYQKQHAEDAEPDAFAAKELQRKAEEERQDRKRREEEDEKKRKEQEAKAEPKPDYGYIEESGDKGGAQHKFSVVITRNIGEAVGLDIDHIDGVAAVVVAVKPGGAIQSWNDNNRDKEIKGGDRIVEVNGSSGDVQQIIQKLKSDLTWRMTVQRPVELLVTIHKANAPTLGLDLKYAPNSKSLLITDVANGPMQDWNNENPGKAVRTNDRIVEINGARGKPQDLIQASDGKDTLEMVIAHYA